MTEPYTGWAIVELMGHRQLAGKVSEAQMYGVTLLRIDTWEKREYAAGDAEPDTTQFYGGSAIYCLTPCDEAKARKFSWPYALPPLALTSGDERPAPGYEDDDPDAPGPSDGSDIPW